EDEMGDEEEDDAGADDAQETTPADDGAQDGTDIQSVSVGNASVERATASASAGSVEVGSGQLGVVAIQDFSAPSEVQPGEEYTVEATVVNVGTGQSVQQVSYRVEGNVVESDLVQVPAGAAATVTINVSLGPYPAGDYTHGVYTGSGNQTGTLTIAEGNQTDDGDMNVSDDEETTPADDDEGEETTPADDEGDDEEMDEETTTTEE
ncbi:hypothetical protein BRD15_06245, partial [Halobacteriales archaeon SW_6_65_15]